MGLATCTSGKVLSMPKGMNRLSSNKSSHSVSIHFRKGLEYFSKTLLKCSINKCRDTASITAAWLSTRRVWVLNWSACSSDLSPVENIYHKKKTQDCWAARIVYQTRMGQHSSPFGCKLKLVDLRNKWIKPLQFRAVPCYCLLFTPAVGG